MFKKLFIMASVATFALTAIPEVNFIAPAQAGVWGKVKGAAKKVGRGTKQVVKAAADGARNPDFKQFGKDNAKFFGGIGKAVGRGVKKAATAKYGFGIPQGKIGDPKRPKISDHRTPSTGGWQDSPWLRGKATANPASPSLKPAVRDHRKTKIVVKVPRNPRRFRPLRSRTRAIQTAPRR
jgi:hypothetical protein